MAQDILVPNIGDFKDVEIIEILVKEGDTVSKGDPMITIESDKSSVEVPSSHSGTIEKLHIKIGDKVSEGSLIASLSGSGEKQIEKIEETKTIEKEVFNSEEVKILTVPQVNIVGNLFVAKIHLSINSKVLKDQTILTIEDDESSIDIPSPLDGTISEILVNKNDSVTPGQEICKIIITSTKQSLIKKTIPPVATPKVVEIHNNTEAKPTQQIPSASPKIMKFARELGVNIHDVQGSGRLGRILEEDIKSHIRININKPAPSAEVSKEIKPKSQETSTF
jgi:pyruvate dehydrogenase E2 component (dihydrolipoamide acetyltransferase)